LASVVLTTPLVVPRSPSDIPLMVRALVDRFDAYRFVDVALVVVESVTVRPVIVASVALRLSTIPVAR
jgi:hypothetical protein